MVIIDYRRIFWHDFDHNWFDSHEETDMKKRLVFAMLIAIALFAICGLTGCSYFGSVTYADSDKYTIGDAEITDKIENIEIDWPSGSVSVVSHSENMLTLSEKAEDDISDELRLHWWLEDTTLHANLEGKIKIR